jgi:hypothetical protein
MRAFPRASIKSEGDVSTMRATSDVGGPVVAQGVEDGDEPGMMPPPGLEDSWFRWPRPASTPPARPSSAPPASFDDDVADGWFR